MAVQRLDKIIASTGRWSRREVKDLVRQGRVTVDGAAARSAEEKTDPETAEIAVNGERLTWRRYTWVMLNKPAGYLSATEDGRGATVLDLLPQELQRQNLFPVGRLDKDTEGLLLLTNQGGLAHDLLSPKKHVDKEYYVRVDGRLTGADCEAGLPAGGVGDLAGGSGQGSPYYHPGRKIPPDQADDGLSGQAGDLSGAGPHGQFDIGFCPFQGELAFSDSRRGKRFGKGRSRGGKNSKLNQKVKCFFVEKRKNSLQFFERAAIIAVLTHCTNPMAGVVSA